MTIEKKENRKYCSVSWEELLYYFFFGILFAAKGVGMESGQKLFTLCILTALVCLAGKLCITKHSVKEWLVMLALAGLGCLIWKSSGEEAALWAFLVIIGMKHVPVKRILTVCFGIWSVTFALSAALGILHVKDGVVVVHEKLGLGPIIRWSLGYTHPNVLHVSYFVLAALILYVCDLHGKKLWKMTAALFLGNLFIFFYSISFTGILLVTGYLALNLYLDMRKKLSIPEKFLVQSILPFCVLFPLVGPFVTSGKVFDFFNKLLNTRFELVRMFFSSFTPTLFGTPADFNKPARLTLDSSFAYLLMYYGIIAFVLFLAGYFAVIHRFVQRGQKKELALMIGIVVAGITEQFLFNLSFKNLSFFFLGELLFDLLDSKGKTASFWNRERTLIPVGERTVNIPWLGEWLRMNVLSGALCAKGVWLLAVAVGVLAAVICAMTIRMPESVYVNHWSTEYRNLEEEIQFDLDQVPEDFNSLVIGYDGPDSKMYIFTGNIIKLEYVRNVIGRGVLAAAVTVVCASGIWIAVFGERQSRQLI